MSDLSNDKTDEELCVLTAQGNRTAEETLVVRYNRLVRALVRPLFLAGGDSEDLLQEGFLGLLDAIRTYRTDKEASFHTFAEVCVRNRVLTAVRAASSGKHSPLNHYVSLDTPLFDGTTDCISFSTDCRQQQSPEEELLAREALQERMKTLRQELSGFESKVLSHYLDGLSYGEIAQATNQSAKSVDNAVQRIKRKLSGK